MSKLLRTNVFASGCFWGTEYFFAKEPGVVRARSGYSGGSVENPSYQQVKKGDTGHLECVEVVWDPQLTTYSKLLKLFFETHDFCQADGQGPDIGSQYLSAVFVKSDEERAWVSKYIKQLGAQGFDVATQIIDHERFWPAEDYHQNYYDRIGEQPSCHFKRNIFTRELE